MNRRRIRGRIAMVMLGALLFAQAAIAAVVCEMPDRAPALAFEPRASMPCHEEPMPNANLCLAHCTNTDQSADTPQVAMPACNAIELPLAVAPVGAIVRTAARRRLQPSWSGPPPRILFQTFLI